MPDNLNKLIASEHKKFVDKTFAHANVWKCFEANLERVGNGLTDMFRDAGKPFSNISVSERRAIPDIHFNSTNKGYIELNYLDDPDRFDFYVETLDNYRIVGPLTDIYSAIVTDGTVVRNDKSRIKWKVNRMTNSILKNTIRPSIIEKTGTLRISRAKFLWKPSRDIYNNFYHLTLHLDFIITPKDYDDEAYYESFTKGSVA